MPKSKALLLLLALALLLPSIPARAVEPTRRITVMSYNVENMYDVFDDPYTEDEGTRVKPRQEYEAIAAVWRQLNPDVIAVIEVENEGVLRAMVAEMLPGAGYEFIAVLPTNSGRGGNIGVVSRLPIVSLTSHRFQPLTLEGEPTQWRFARDLLRVRVQATEAVMLDLYVVHFKSRQDFGSDKNSSQWRLAEATGARRIIDGYRAEFGPESDYTLMLGDFNDYPDSAALKTLLSPRPDAATPLIDMHAALPAKKRITYLHEPYRSTIDYMLAGPALAKRVVPGSALVPDDPKLLSGSGHAPLIASFDLPSQ